MFVNLHTNSYYNFLNSALSPKKLVNLAINDQQKAVAITDPNLFGAVEFFITCKQNNIKPIIGLNLTVEYQKNDVKLLLIAKSNKGFQTLNKIALIQQKLEINSLVDQLTDIAVIICSLTTWKSTYKDVYQAKGIEINQTPIAILANAVNCEKTNSDQVVLTVLKQMKQNQTGKITTFDWDLKQKLNQISINENLKVKSEIQPFLDQKTAQQLFSETELNNLNDLVNRCELDLEHLKAASLSLTDNDAAVLESLCQTNLKQFLDKNQDLNKKAYQLRLEKELNVINKLNFASYFLVVNDLVNYAFKKDILIGSGRGSAVGSLVAFLLNITKIDPVQHQLIFERFISTHRQDLPDIDIDIMENKRAEMINYLFEKYGKENCAQIVTFQRFKTRSAVKEVAKLFNDYGISDMILGVLPKDQTITFTDLKATEDSALQLCLQQFGLIVELALAIVDFPRQSSIHASGIVIASNSLIKTIPLLQLDNNHFLTQVSMEWLSFFNLNKFDLLGLINLTMISDVITQIKPSNQTVNQFLNTISWTDQNTFINLVNEDTLGIFQLESFGMKKLLVQIKPKTINQLAIVLALYRPGAQDNINLFINRLHNGYDQSDIDPRILPIVKNTYGVLIFQEQIINIVKVVANYSLEEADSFRRAISKKDVKLIQKNKRNFFERAVQNNFDLKTTTKIFSYIERFANYGFNLSHALGYALLSYWTAWLKTNYPVYFYLWLLNHFQSSKNKQKLIIRTLEKSGIEIYPPLLNKAQPNSVIENKKIYLGLNLIKGINDRYIQNLQKVQHLIQTQNNLQLTDVVSWCLDKTIGDIPLKDLLLLKTMGCFDFFEYTYDFNDAKDFWIKSDHLLFTRMPLEKKDSNFWIKQFFTN